MTCDLCGKSEATVHLTEIIDDQSRELHLCEACAREKGAGAEEEFGLAGLLAGLSDFGLKLEGRQARKLACSRCGMSFEDFRKSGRLGCGGCYEAFRQQLAPLLKRIHGATQHVGRVPVAAGKRPARARDEIGQLKERLKAAVAAEAFEEAARLRDQIRALEATPKTKRGQTPSRNKGV